MLRMFTATAASCGRDRWPHDRRDRMLWMTRWHRDDNRMAWIYRYIYWVGRCPWLAAAFRGQLDRMLREDGNEDRWRDDPRRCAGNNWPAADFRQHDLTSEDSIIGGHDFSSL
jgi:hypothetical protein